MNHADEWRVVADGFAFVEGIRWHDGALWASDVFAREVVRIDEAEVSVVARIPGRPSGLGWAPDGALLICSMRDRQLLRLLDGAIEVVADLAPVTGGDCNDMLVDRSGRAYIGNFGYDYAAGHQRRSTSLVLVDADAAVRTVADDLWFPNGMALTPDGRTLFVAETPAERISAFRVSADGSLHDRRTLADLDGLRPDGICLDDRERLWVASPATGELACLTADGRIRSRERAPDGTAQTCTIGGVNGRTLFVCGTPTHDEAEALERRAGRVFARSLD